MTERMYESLSAIMDDEANELELERVLANIGSDDDLRQVWSRYNLVRDAASSQPPAYLDRDISKQVSAAVAAGDAINEGVVADGFRQRFVRPLTSFAVAASVAATVVIGGQQLASVGEVNPDGGDRALAASASPVGMVNSLGATTVRASYGTQAIPVLRPATSTAYQELARQRMSRFMQEHAEHAALNSPQGLIPFARVPRISE